MEASNKIKLACQHALTFTFLQVCIRNFHPTQETNIATPAMQFLVEKAVGKDTLALRVNYVIFYGFLRVFYGDFTGFLRLWVHLRVFYTQKPGFWTCHLRADSHQMHCGIPARTGKSNRGRRLRWYFTRSACRHFIERNALPSPPLWSYYVLLTVAM